MINEKLIQPSGIVVIGGSDDISKPGGKVLRNLIQGRFRGSLYVVNPKSDSVQGITSFRDINLLPSVDLAILAVPAKMCLQSVEILAAEKSTRAFIILSAGFGEESSEGKLLERKIVKVIDRYNGCLIGPNCIGFLNTNYNGIFTTPIPSLSSGGADFISGSGATAVFIMESAIPGGIRFSSVWSVGNSAQTGVEDVLEYLDNTYVEGVSSKVKLLYIESIEKPAKLLKHASSLIRKGCRIAAIKSGSSEAGSRAASSHTGALAGSDLAAEVLFRKAGIVRCHSRNELTAVASVFMLPVPKGNKIAIITHAGGPAVMLTDALTKNGLEVPGLSGVKADALRTRLFPGSSVGNPIDFLATGTAGQLGLIIDACENDFDNIDAMAVIFGSPGLFPVYDVYDLLHDRMRTCKKAIFPILPSVINVRDEINHFVGKGNVFFPDEVVFAHALSAILNTPAPAGSDGTKYNVDGEKIRSIICSSPDGYLRPESVAEILDAAGIPRVAEGYATSATEAVSIAEVIGYPVVMKVTGPVHKSDSGGVTLNLQEAESVLKEFTRLMKIEGAKAVLIQKMAWGTELFAGIKSEGNFGHMVLAGLGGIFIEVLRDVSAGLVPVNEKEALYMIRSLKSYRIIKGARGKEGIDEAKFAEIICRLSLLAEEAPEIIEMDLNPLLGLPTHVQAVDARILIRKLNRNEDGISDSD
jgi:acetate---CoA ligase (ADP-forming)